MLKRALEMLVPGAGPDRYDNAGINLKKGARISWHLGDLEATGVEYMWNTHTPHSVIRRGQ